MGFRDDAIQHNMSQDAFKFFNDTYGLDFSLSQPNEENEKCQAQSVQVSSRRSLLASPQQLDSDRKHSCDMSGYPRWRILSHFPRKPATSWQLWMC